MATKNPIDAATTDLTKAEQHLTDLEQKIAAGDRTVKPGDLADAESSVRLAQMRLDAAKNIAEQNQEAERVRAIEAVKADVEAAANDPAPFLEALRAIDDAILNWYRLNEERTEQIRAWRKRLRELGVEEARNDTSRPEPFGIAPLHHDYDRVSVRVENDEFSAINAAGYVNDLATLPVAAFENPARRSVDLYTRLTIQLGSRRKSGGPE
ncbi:hypothetical protein [Microbacterium immunditiarum]|uniref:Uncharacterized protein n=1 Tax=Microbacterium immunditiarum TaxID=337480 RepID=A0A7Y9KKR6_9MICO|nr:hypothetical protein [Microbacterium immunditiarum]NYE19463.1 hypothetical protein [Microbacterium immunditiarum]